MEEGISKIGGDKIFKSGVGNKKMGEPKEKNYD